MAVEAETDVEQAQQTAEEARARLSRTFGKLILASIGALALVQETLESLLDRMVERGEQVEAAARRQADVLMDKPRHALGLGKQKVETALDTADFPTNTDMRTLQNQVAALSAKVEQLSEAKSSASDAGTGLILPDGSTPAHSETPVSDT